MLPLLGAASSALGALQSLLPSKQSSSQTAGQTSANPFDTDGAAPSQSSTPASGSSGFTQISPATMSALLVAQSQSATGPTSSAPTSPSSALQDLFSKIDTNGDGQITKAEFESALGAGGTNTAQADKVFNMIDKNGTGSISLSDLSSALKGAGGKNHAGGSGGADSDGGGTGGTANASGAGSSASASNANALLQALQGASSTSAINSDGSTTTSMTFADGSKVTMTSPAAATSSSSTTASSNATSSYNLVQQMMQREVQAFSSNATQSLSFTA